MKSEWISVNDRLPDYMQNCLIYNGNPRREKCIKEMNISIAMHCVPGHFTRTNVPDKYITYWMPLPEPPEGE